MRPKVLISLKGWLSELPSVLFKPFLWELKWRQSRRSHVIVHSNAHLRYLWSIGLPAVFTRWNSPKRFQRKWNTDVMYGCRKIHMVSVVANLVMKLLKTRERSGGILPTEGCRSLRFSKCLTSVQCKNFRRCSFFQLQTPLRLRKMIISGKVLSLLQQWRRRACNISPLVV